MASGGMGANLGVAESRLGALVALLLYDGLRISEALWCPGELRMWTQDDEGAWAAQVQYQPPGSPRE